MLDATVKLTNLQPIVILQLVFYNGNPAYYPPPEQRKTAVGCPNAELTRVADQQDTPEGEKT